MKSLITFVWVLFFVSIALSQSEPKTATPTPSPTPQVERPKSNCGATYIAVDLLVASPRRTSEASIEYNWKCGQYFVGGGFIEDGKGRNVISRHNIRVKPLPKHLPWLAIRNEFAFNGKGYGYQFGPQTEFTQLPVIKKVFAPAFRTFSVTPMWRPTGTVGVKNETQVAWNTKQFRVGNTKGWLEGFLRIRGGFHKNSPRTDYGQFQGWVTSDKLSSKLARIFGYDERIKIALGFEVEHTGWHKRHNPMFGLKIYK